MYRSIFINVIVFSCLLSRNGTSYYDSCKNKHIYFILKHVLFVLPNNSSYFEIILHIQLHNFIVTFKNFLNLESICNLNFSVSMKPEEILFGRFCLFDPCSSIVYRQSNII